MYRLLTLIYQALQTMFEILVFGTFILVVVILSIFKIHK